MVIQFNALDSHQPACFQANIFRNLGNHKTLSENDLPSQEGNLGVFSPILQCHISQFPVLTDIPPPASTPSISSNGSIYITLQLQKVLFHKVSIFINHVLLTKTLPQLLSPPFSGNVTALFFHVNQGLSGKGSRLCGILQHVPDTHEYHY